MDQIYVVIDIGTSKVSALIGRMNGLGQVDVLGKGTEVCPGIKKGNIADIESTADSIKSSVSKSEEMSGFHVKSAYVNISGKHLSLLNTINWIELYGEKREITKEDIDNVMDKTRHAEIPRGNYIIDIVPRGYMADDYDLVADPLGMVASSLGVDADLIIGDRTAVHNIMKCMEKAGIKIEGLIIDSISMGNMFLTQDARQMGTLLIDVGGEVTNISCLKNNKLVFVGSLPVGGENITNDIAIGLKLPFSEAERLKNQYNLALSSLINFDQEDKVSDISGSGRKTVRVSEVVEIIEARVNEIFTLCAEMVSDSEVNQEDIAGILLTGRGISYLSGAVELAEEQFRIPAKIAVLKNGSDLKPEYYNCAAMLNYAASNYNNAGMVVDKTSDEKSRNKRSRKNFLGNIMDLFRNLF